MWDGRAGIDGSNASTTKADEDSDRSEYDKIIEVICNNSTIQIVNGSECDGEAILLLLCINSVVALTPSNHNRNAPQNIVGINTDFGGLTHQTPERGYGKAQRYVWSTVK